jgi:hypothetical protein
LALINEDTFNIIEPTMNTNELNDTENTASLDLSSINVMGMGLAGVDSSAGASALGSSSQYPNQPMKSEFQPPPQQNPQQRTTPPPILPPPPTSSSTGSSSTTPNNQNNPNQSKSSSKKRKLEDLGLENISDSEGSSSNSASNSSSNLYFLNIQFNHEL